MSTRLIITAAGTAIGAAFGNPALGYALGSLAGNLIDPAGEDVQGPRLDDLSVQTSSYGAPIPRHYGTVRCAGNLIWSSGLIETKHEEEAGGKGGGPTVTNYTYSASFAISFGEGPIVGIRRIWADSKLLYDKSDTATAESLLASESKATGIRVYPGNETQLADPTIESYEGAGNVPAYRGQCYVLFEALQLADFGNRIPNITAEIVETGTVAPAARLALTGAVAQSPYNATSYPLSLPTFDDVFAVTTRDQRNVFGLDGQSITTEAVAPRTGYEEYCGGYLGDALVIKKGQFDGDLVLRSGPVERFIARRGPGTSEYLGGYCVTPDRQRLYVVLQTSAGFVLRGYDQSLNVVHECVQTVLAWPFTSGDAKIWPGSTRCFAIESDYRHLWFASLSIYRTLALYYIEDDGSLTLLRTFDQPADRGPSGDNCILLADRTICAMVGISNDKSLSVGVWRRTSAVASTSLPLADIVTSLCAACGLAPADINVAALTGDVLGYTRSRPMNVRAALQPLQQAYFFDLVESDWTLKFIPRGGASVRTITEDNLACHEYGAERPEALEITRVQELELPRRVHVQYLSKVRDYQTDEQYSARLITESDVIANVQLPVVMTATKARQVAEVLHYDAWTERLQYPFALGPEHMDLDPGDVITVTARGGTHTVRLTNTNLALPGLCALQGVADEAAVYVSEAAGAETIVPARGIGLEGPTRLELLDIPMLRDADDNAGIYAAASGYLGGWRGAQIFKSNDGGDTHAAQQAITRQATLGNATNALASGPTTIIDRGNTLNVRLLAGTLSSITELALLNGANHAVLGADDRWEVLGFQSAALQADGTYTLSGLLRGRRGSEVFIATHTVGDTFVVLTEATLSRLSVDLAAIGQTRAYKGVSFGRTLQRTAAQAIAHNAVALKPYAPVHIAGARDGSGNLTISWVRRSRIGAELRDFVEIPLGEASEAYEVEVYSGATLKRTLTGLTTPSAAYSAALQVTDFGAAQSAVSVKVYQLSAAIGRGSAGAATV